MSRFSNPSSAAAGAASSYVSALLEVLGDRDPLDVMAATGGRLQEVATSVTDAQLRRPEAAGKWSMLQVLQHLADTELIYATRFRFPVAHDNPPIQPFDQNLWVDRLWRGDEPLQDVLGARDALRAMNLRFLSRLTDGEWARTGQHSERGEESVLHMVRLGAAHDLVHTRQLERIRDTVRAAG